MICSYCAKENPDEAVICNYCGAPLVIKEESSATEPLFTVPEENIVEPPEPPEVLPPAPTLITPQKPRGIYGNKIWWVVGCVGAVIIFLCCGVGVLVASQLVGNIPDFLLTPSTILSTLEPVSLATLNPSLDIPVEDSPATPDPNLIFFDDFSDPEIRLGQGG